MEEMTVRRSTPADKAELMTLWEKIFGDGEDYTAPFLETFFKNGGAMCAETDGRIAAALFPVPAGEMVYEDGGRESAVMIYALGTDENYRNNGAASKLLDAAGGFSYLRPAEGDLFGFYEKHGYSDAFSYRELIFTDDELIESGVRVLRTDAKTYRAVREKRLESTAHIDMSEELIAFADRCASESGGGLFITEDGGACAYVESCAGRTLVKELLCGEEDINGIVYELNKEVPGNVIKVRTPGRDRFGMAKNMRAGVCRAWFGFALD